MRSSSAIKPTTIARRRPAITSGCSPSTRRDERIQTPNERHVEPSLGAAAEFARAADLVVARREIDRLHQDAQRLRCRFGRRGRCKLDVASGSITPLTSHGKYEGFGEYSPDGTHVAYWYPQNGDNPAVNEIYVAPASGGDGNDADVGRDRYQRATLHLDARFEEPLDLGPQRHGCRAVDQAARRQSHARRSAWRAAESGLLARCLGFQNRRDRVCGKRTQSSDRALLYEFGDARAATRDRLQRRDCRVQPRRGARNRSGRTTASPRTAW